MAHLTNFSFEFFYEILTEGASLPLLFHDSKKSKMTKNSNRGGGGGGGRSSFYKHLFNRRGYPDFGYPGRRIGVDSPVSGKNLLQICFGNTTI